jgi:hypothetical protein
MQPAPDIDFDAIAPERLPALLRTMPKSELHGGLRAEAANRTRSGPCLGSLANGS